MAFSDAPSPRWDRIAGVAVWFLTGFALLNPLSGFIVADCVSEHCSPSLGWRVFALILLAFSASAVAGWLATALLQRLLYGRAG